MKYLRSNVIHDAQTDQALDKMIGRESFTFTATRRTVDLAAWQAVINGAPMRAQPSHVDVPYTIVSASDHAISISAAGTTGGNMETTVYHFDDKNTIWIDEEIDLANAPMIREYFTRAP